MENSTIFPHHYQEMRESFIDDSLIALNIHSLSGFQAQDKYFQYWEGKRLNTGIPPRKLIENTNHFWDGVWFVHIETISGLKPHFKPDNPRIVDGKILKYEQIKSSPSGAFLPKITYGHIKKIAKRNSIRSYPKGYLDAHFPEAWEWIAQNKRISIAITEGWKKALALMSIGIPAIGLSGVHNFNNSAQNKTLLPVFFNFKQHIFCFFYDNDRKEKTIKTVNAAITKLCRQISLAGISKEFQRCTWTNTISKGIDDYLFDHNGDEKYLEYKTVLPGQFYQEVEPNLVLDTRYLTDKNRNCCQELKEALDNNRVVAIKSEKGTAKTEAISDYTAKFQEVGTKILVPTHRIQLMSELSRRFQIANAFNHRKSLDKALEITLCIDSMHANSSVKFDVERYIGCVLVIDEVDQVLEHLISSTTDVKKRRPEIIEILIRIFRSAEKVIVASADITQDVIDFLETNCEEKVYIVENKYKSTNGSCNIYIQSKPEPFLDDFFKAADRGENIIFFTNSQKLSSSYSTQNLELLLKEKYPHYKIMRVDSHTVADPTREEYMCMEDVNKFIEDKMPDILLISPVLETGIDISTDYFDSYWGMNWGVTSINSFSQAMARVRMPIPRCIWSSNSSSSIVGNGSCFSSGLVKSQKHQSEINKLIFLSFNDELEWYTNDSCLKYWAERGAVNNTQKKMMVKSVIAKFASDYKNIKIIEEASNNDTNKSIRQKIATNKKSNIDSYHKEIVAAPFIDNKTFKSLIDKKEKTFEDRCTERKNSLIRYIAPRSMNVEITKELLEIQDSGLMPKINLHWLLIQGLKFSHDFDSRKIEEMEFSIDLNKKLIAPKIAYLIQFRVLEIINNPSDYYYSSHPLVVETGSHVRSGFNSIRESEMTIRDLWSIKRLSEKSTEWNLTKWCLGLLGFEFKMSRRSKDSRLYSLIDIAGEFRSLIFEFWDVERSLNQED
ncbi:plasmid replication protein, CyRepA1 family [Okeania sp. SIO1I7]|uniref:plasmid replication protein, CyRepA1 family n=1 Tax=Okeania sp. SIO1I7 TaxID=2607772 RepID=UPI0013FB9DA1|nr:plasmid replication protein, CyRepA1 family [Okeania sp. SIO1I7]NET30252.1 DUF3854 domain-containing protein [Okeania sp. SIO1I7]